MRVQFQPLNIDGQGCYRCVFPAVWLADRGHDASIPRFVVRDVEGRDVPPLPLPGLLAVPPGFFNVAFVEDVRPADVYVVQIGTKRFMGEYADRARARGARVVVDLDDDVFRVPAYNPGKQTAEGRRVCRELLGRADAVTVSTPELARFYSRWNDNVHVLPNRLHWPMWSDVTPVYEQTWRRFRVGYMGNVDFHGADLATVAPSVGKWVREHPGVEFVAAGDPRIHDVFGIPEGQRVTLSKVWFRNMDLASITATMDVGLAPLVRNDFNEGKSCLKGMEYNACGIPVLASPTEEYRRWVEDGVNGFLCRYPRDFVARLDVLLHDPVLRRQMGVRARDRARESSLDRHVGAWEAVYEGLCDHPVAARQGAAA